MNSRTVANDLARNFLWMLFPVSLAWKRKICKNQFQECETPWIKHFAMQTDSQITHLINPGYSSVGRASDCRRCRHQMVPGSIPGGRILHQQNCWSDLACCRWVWHRICLCWPKRLVCKRLRYFSSRIIVTNCAPNFLLKFDIFIKNCKDGSTTASQPYCCCGLTDDGNSGMRKANTKLSGSMTWLCE